MSSLKLADDLLQHDPSPYYKRIKTQDQISKEGFPKFGKLPAELRLKVWENAMPPYGIFTALMFGREEPKPQQPPPPAPMAFRVVYRLEPVPRDQQDDELRMRLDTMRAIQSTNSEAASEVQRAFPTTINCTGGKLRFNAEHDTLSLSYTHRCLYEMGIYMRFKRYSQGAMVFADDWHKIPRKMVINNRLLYGPLSAMDSWLQGSIPASHSPRYGQFVEGFMEFLADCAGLRSFGFMYDHACHDELLSNMDLETLNDEVLRFCYQAPLMKNSFYNINWPRVSLSNLKLFVAALKSLDALVHGPGHGQQLPNHWQGMRFGRPELQHLHFQVMLPASPALRDKMKGAGQASV